MAIVGQATVVVRAVTDQFRRDLRASFQDAEREADVAGERAGGRFGASFSRSAASSIEDIDLSDIADGADIAGDTGGRRFSAAFNRSSGDAGDDAGKSFKKKLADHVEDATDDMEDEVSDAGDNVGRKLSGIKFELPDIGGRLAVKILALIPLVGVLGGALAAIVGGLTAMAAAATFAAGSLAVLATGAAFAASGILTAVLALGGVGEAVKALGQEQASAGRDAISAARQQEAAARQIEAAQDRVVQANRRLRDAIEALAAARKNAAREATQDAQAVADAEYRLGEAQEDARRAQEGLTRARENAVEKLEDLQLTLRGAVIGEEEAQLRLREAQEEYQRVLNDADSTFAEQERARLDLENAELALDQAKDRREDVTEQTEEANKAGIEGSDEVVAAKERINDANHNVAMAERALRDARQDQRDDAVENARDIRNAQEGVADATREVARAARDLARAQRDAAEGANALSSAANKVKDAFKDMSPEAQRFARFLFGLKPVLLDLRAAAGERLFGPLQTAIQNVVTGFLPTLRQALVLTGGALGELALRLASAFTSDTFKANFSAITVGLTRLNTGLRDANGNVKDGVSTFGLLGSIISNVISAITGIARAALPTFVRFLNYIDNVTHAFAGRFEGEANIARMTDLISRMGDAAATIGSIFGQTFGLIGDVFKAALPTGLELNNTLLGTIRNLREFTRSAEGQERIRTFFEKIVPVFKSVGRFVAALAREFLKLGEDSGGGITETFNKVTKALPSVASAITTFTDKVAPRLVEIITKVISVFRELSESPFIDMFFKTLNLGIGLVTTFLRTFDQPGVTKFTGAIGGVAAAVYTMKRSLDRLGLGFINKAFGKLASTLSAPLVRALKGNIGVLRFLGGHYLRLAADAAKSFARQAAGAVIARARTIALAVAQRAVALATKAWAAVQWLLNAAMNANPVGLLVAAIAILVAGLVVAYKRSETFRNIVNKVGRVLKTVATFILGVVIRAFRFLKNHLQLVLLAFGPLGIAIAVIITAFRNFDKIKEFVGKAINAVIGFFRALPGKVWTFLSDTVRRIATFYVQAYAWLFTKMWELLGSLVGFFRDLPGRILAFLGSLASAAGELAGAVARFFVEKVRDLVNSVVQFYIDLPGRIFSIAGNLGSKLLALAGYVRTYLRDRIASFIGNIVQFFKDLPGKIGAFASNLGSKVADLASRVATNFRDKISTMISNVVGYFRDLPGKIAGYAGKIGSAALTIGKTIINKIIEGIKGMPAMIGGLAADVADLIRDLGKGIINGVIDAINNMLPNHVAKVEVKGVTIFPGLDLPDNPIPRLARGATVLPRPGGTVALLAEAGRAESVVDTGLLNKRLRDDTGRGDAIVAELRRVRAAIERTSALNGLTIEQLVAQAAPGEPAASSVPRALRALAFELGA